MSRLPTDVVAALWATLGDEPTGDESGGDQVDAEAGLDDVEVGDDGERSFFNELKQDPGRLGLETLLAEIVKLRRARAIGLPADLFTDVAEKRVARWRARRRRNTRQRCAGITRRR